MESHQSGAGVCSVPVRQAAMVQWWDELVFLHWRYSAAEVQALLPRGLDVETCDGSAWVGLVPFFLRVGLPGVRPVPWMSEFAETNVRTYVRGPHGESGLWFFSLDAARLAAVVAARATYRLPYFWSRMRLDHTGNTIRYTCRRRWPGPRGTRSQAQVEIGEAYEPDTLSQLDHFLTARWALFSAARSGLRQARHSTRPGRCTGPRWYTSTTGSSGPPASPRRAVRPSSTTPRRSTSGSAGRTGPTPTGETTPTPFPRPDGVRAVSAGQPSRRQHPREPVRADEVRSASVARPTEHDRREAPKR